MTSPCLFQSPLLIVLSFTYFWLQFPLAPGRSDSQLASSEWLPFHHSGVYPNWFTIKNNLHSHSTSLSLDPAFASIYPPDIFHIHTGFLASFFFPMLNPQHRGEYLAHSRHSTLFSENAVLSTNFEILKSNQCLQSTLQEKCLMPSKLVLKKKEFWCLRRDLRSLEYYKMVNTVTLAHQTLCTGSSLHFKKEEWFFSHKEKPILHTKCFCSTHTCILFTGANAESIN